MTDTLITVKNPFGDSVTFKLLTSKSVKRFRLKTLVPIAYDVVMKGYYERPIYLLPDSTFLISYNDIQHFHFRTKNEMNVILSNKEYGVSSIFLFIEDFGFFYHYRVNTKYISEFCAKNGRHHLVDKIGIHNEISSDENGSLVVFLERAPNVFQGDWFPDKKSLDYDVGKFLNLGED